MHITKICWPYVNFWNTGGAGDCVFCEWLCPPPVRKIFYNSSIEECFLPIDLPCLIREDRSQTLELKKNWWTGGGSHPGRTKST